MSDKIRHINKLAAMPKKYVELKKMITFVLLRQ